MRLLRHLALIVVVVFVAVVFGAFALNYYRAWRAGNEPPAIIFERSDRPSKA